MAPVTRKTVCLAPFLLFVLLLGLLWRGLSLNPRELPSALLNKPVPNFILPSLLIENSSFSNRDLIGHVSLVNVWATWCTTCREEHSFLLDLAKSKAIAMYSIDYKDDKEASKTWLQQYGNPYQNIGFDVDGRASIDWGVYGTPETFIVDKQGVIRYKLVGELTSQRWQQQIAPLVRELAE